MASVEIRSPTGTVTRSSVGDRRLRKAHEEGIKLSALIRDLGPVPEEMAFLGDEEDDDIFEEDEETEDEDEEDDDYDDDNGEDYDEDEEYDEDEYEEDLDEDEDEGDE
jgi:hypothetical protein